MDGDRDYVVLTAVGPDRPGLVNALSSLIDDAGANIEDSRMAILGGEFAVILLISGSPGAVERAKEIGARVERELELRFILKETSPARSPSDVVSYRIDVSGADRPGIVQVVRRHPGRPWASTWLRSSPGSPTRPSAPRRCSCSKRPSRFRRRSCCRSCAANWPPPARRKPRLPPRTGRLIEEPGLLERSLGGCDTCVPALQTSVTEERGGGPAAGGSGRRRQLATTYVAKCRGSPGGRPRCGCSTRSKVNPGGS